MNPDRGYNPPDSTLADLKHLHKTLGVDRVVFTQPSTYGTDNSAILDGMTALNAETPNRARCVVAITMDITDKELAALNDKGARGVRLNTDNKGGMPIGFDQIGELEARIRPFSWHIEWLFPGKDILELMPVFKTIKVPQSIGHFAYQPATATREGAGLPGAARPHARRQHLDEDFRRQPRQRDRPAALRRRHADGACADRGGARAHHVGHRLAAPQQVRRQSERRRSGRLRSATGCRTHAMRQKIMVDTPAKFYRF